MIEEVVTAVFRCPMCRTQNLKKFFRGRIQEFSDIFCQDCNRWTGQKLVNVVK